MLSQRRANELYAHFGALIALQSMVITKQQHIGGEGNTIVKLFSVHPIEISLHFPIGELAYNLQFPNTTTRE